MSYGEPIIMNNNAYKAKAKKYPLYWNGAGVTKLVTVTIKMPLTINTIASLSKNIINRLKFLAEN